MVQIQHRRRQAQWAIYGRNFFLNSKLYLGLPFFKAWTWLKGDNSKAHHVRSFPCGSGVGAVKSFQPGAISIGKKTRRMGVECGETGTSSGGGSEEAKVSSSEADESFRSSRSFQSTREARSSNGLCSCNVRQSRLFCPASLRSRQRNNCSCLL